MGSPPVYRTSHYPALLRTVGFGSPLITEEGLHLEIEIRELDTSVITFPPIGTRTKRRQAGLYLDIPWDVLERDRDEDGLTDLVLNKDLVRRILRYRPS